MLWSDGSRVIPEVGDDDDDGVVVVVDDDDEEEEEEEEDSVSTRFNKTETV